ncbi:MAG: general stress protein [Acidimicrobiales bacterium]
MYSDPSDTAEPAPSPPVKLVSYTDYAQAQAAVDTLSDQGFPVSTVSIVWSGLRRIEYVTGRRTVVNAAIEGAIAGAWFGTLLGWLFAIFAGDDGASTVSIVFTYFVVGTIAGAIWYGVGHALRRGRRDFGTSPQLDAESYELWVDPRNLNLAADILGVYTTRADDPTPDVPADDMSRPEAVTPPPPDRTSPGAGTPDNGPDRGPHPDVTIPDVAGPDSTNPDVRPAPGTTSGPEAR